MRFKVAVEQYCSVIQLDDSTHTYLISRILTVELNLSCKTQACNSVFLIRSYGAPNGIGRCSLWPSVMKTLGTYWHKVKWANIAK